MTLLGKCFSAAILLLSFGFMVLALAVNASHRNWRDVVLGPNGYKSKIEAFINSMRPFGITELVRTGRIAMVRSDAKRLAEVAQR